MAELQKPKYTAAQQLMLFNDNTNLYKSPVQTQSGSENGTNKFVFDQTKLLHKIYLEISCILTATHASSSTYTPHEDGIFNIINKVSLISHKGFRPFDISGKILKMVNYANLGDDALTVGTSGRYRQKQPLVASSGGTANSCYLLAEIQPTINDRDLAGLILLQNDKVNLTLEVTLGDKSSIAPVSSGYTFALSAISLKVTTDLFNIPEDLNIYPIDLIRVVKLTHEISLPVIVNENTHKLTTGNTFRKIFLQFLDSAGARAADSTLGDIYIIKNGSTYQYQISPTQLALENKAAGYSLPAGCFIFDFASGQGLRNLAGRRDYLNTDGLGELYIRHTSTAAGSVIIGIETLTTMS
jgi:hypothetical protein